MTKKRRLLSLLLCLWMLLPLFAVFSVPASAAGAAEMDASDVVDDLNVMGVDLSKYPANSADDRVEIIKFLEFGYKANGDYSEYGLYLYLYNPCGKAVTGGRNAVQLAYGLNAGGVTSYIKYRLTVLSRSTGSGRENVFLKVKVEGAEAIAPMLNKAARQYRISGVEILRPGNANATDYNYGVGTFTFTGYHKGCQSNDYSTLRCIADKLDVVELELHPVTYYVKTKELGSLGDMTFGEIPYTEYSEVFGVYFSVPDWVIAKYGNLDDENLKGLARVEGTYREARTNGILSDSDVMLGLFDTPAKRRDNYFRSWNVGAFYCEYNCKPYVAFGDTLEHHVATLVYQNLWKKSKAVNGLSAEEFRRLYNGSGRSALSRSDLKRYAVNAADVATVSQSKGKFLDSLYFMFKGDSPKVTSTVDMLQRISRSDTESLTVTQISEIFKVTEADAEDLKAFVGKQTDSTSYVMHFAVRDCISARINEAGTLDRDALVDHFDEVSGIGNSYYFEKTVIEDFDILQMTFQNKENKLSVVPVSASPIDVTGGIPAPGQSNPNAKPSDTSFWRTLLKVVAVILVIVLLILAVRLFGGFGKLFGAIGRGLSKGYRSAQKQFRTWKARRKQNAPKQKKPKKKKSKQKKENES